MKVKENSQIITNWILNNRSKVHKYILYFIILFLSIFALDSLFNTSHPEVQSPKIEYREVTKWKDADSNSHYVIKQLQLDKESFKKQSDSLRRLLKLKEKEIVSITSMASKVDTGFSEKVIYVDSTNTYQFHKKDNYLDLSGVLYKNDNKVDLKLGMLDTLTIVPYHKVRFFKESYGVDVSNKSPYVNIVSGYSYQYSKPTKRFGIGPNISFDISNKKVIFGVGIQYNIIRF